MQKAGKTKIMVFGTFDLVHSGHLSFFRQARKLARSPFLVVSVARDVNVKKIKGARPSSGEKKRLGQIKKLPLVDKAVLGGVGNFLPHILKEKPEIIALGYDQSAYTENLRGRLASHGLKVRIFRLKPFKPKVFKTSLLKAGKLGKK